MESVKGGLGLNHQMASECFLPPLLVLRRIAHKAMMAPLPFIGAAHADHGDHWPTDRRLRMLDGRRHEGEEPTLAPNDREAFSFTRIGFLPPFRIPSSFSAFIRRKNGRGKCVNKGADLLFAQIRERQRNGHNVHGNNVATPVSYPKDFKIIIISKLK